MNCHHCADTGSLAKHLDGLLDCTRCEAAGERAVLEAWAQAQRLHCDLRSLWLIYQHGKKAASPA